MTKLPPPPSVLAAFGVSGTPVPLDGGQGLSWRIDDMVVKPLDRGAQELAWQAEVLASIRCDGFRVAPPLRAQDGSFVVDGWCAWDVVEGKHEAGRWPEIIAIGERFHAALASVARPDFISRRADPWAIGDRVAWEELPATEVAHVKHLARLAAARKPITAPNQLIHSDLTGNVLFDDGPPAIIDFSPLWRPTGYASAIVVADALVWEGANEDLLVSVAQVEHFEQYLLRALIFRAFTDRLFRMHAPTRPDDADPYRPAVCLALRLASDAEPLNSS